MIALKAISLARVPYFRAAFCQAKVSTRNWSTAPELVEVGRKAVTLFDSKSREEFSSFLDVVVNDMKEYSLENDILEGGYWMDKIIKYNTVGGKNFRGNAWVFLYQNLLQNPTAEDVRKSYVLGWCAEIMRASFIVADDIIDGSLTRRGQPCWYKVNDQGTVALNDSMMLENIAYLLLDKYFKDEPYYNQLVSTVHEVALKTALGQSLDYRTKGPLANPEIQKLFTMERYATIARLKTSFCTVYLPVFLALSPTGRMGGNYDDRAKELLEDIGLLFQAQEDHLNCFGDETVTEKFGRNILDGKCTWLIVRALEKANKKQLQTLCEHYGNGANKDDVSARASINTVVDVYKELLIPTEFENLKATTYEAMLSKIKEIDEQDRFLFLDVLDFLYKRH